MKRLGKNWWEVKNGNDIWNVNIHMFGGTFYKFDHVECGEEIYNEMKPTREIEKLVSGIKYEPSFVTEEEAELWQKTGTL